MRVVPLLTLLAFTLACGFGAADDAPDAPKAAAASPADQAAAGAADLDELIQAFLSSAYTSCDATILSRMLDIDHQQAKAHIGEKLRLGVKPTLDAQLERARELARRDPARRCRFHETSFHYDDALALAVLWGVSVEGAKEMIEEKIAWGNEAMLRDEVLPMAAAQLAARGGNPEIPSEGGINGFANSVFDHCHATMLLGTAYGNDVEQVKITIGNKLAHGESQRVRDDLDAQRVGHQDAGSVPCPFHETGFTYADAEVLATAWDQPVHEIKAKIELAYAWSNEFSLRETIESLRTSP